MITHITSGSNATLKRLRSLARKKYRKAEGLFLAEGARICSEALDAGWVPETLLFSEEGSGDPQISRLSRATLAAGKPVIETTPALLSTVSGKDNPQAVIAAYRPRQLSLADYLPKPITLVAERLRDPGNLGTLLRSCDAVGAGALILVGECADPTSPEAVRASMGAYFSVPTFMVESGDLLSFRDRHQAKLIGAAYNPQATDYREADFTAPSLLLLGNETEGLPDRLLDACDQLVSIPMLGRASSLNVAMAGTILLYEALRKQPSCPARTESSAAHRP